MEWLKNGCAILLLYVFVSVGLAFLLRRHDELPWALSFLFLSGVGLKALWNRVRLEREAGRQVGHLPTSKLELLRRTDFGDMTPEEYEHRVALEFMRLGWKTTVTPPSRDYGADIVAISPHGEKTCIQCKRYKGVVGVSAVQEIVAAKAYYDCTEAIVVTSGRYTAAAWDLACTNGVRLMRLPGENGHLEDEERG